MNGEKTKTLTLADAFREGVELQRRGDMAGTERIYREIVKAKPDFAEAHNNLGVALKALERPEEAIESYRKAVAINPDYAEAHNNLGNALMALDRSEDAVESYRRALVVTPDYREALNNLGHALKSAERHQEAVEIYRKLLAIMPEDAYSHVSLGESLEALKRHEEAAASYRKALAIKPEDAEIHCNLANALRELGRNEEAAAIYRDALAIRPGYAVARNNLGVSLQALNRHQEAVESFRRALAIAPDYAQAHTNCGLSLLSIGDFENGWREYEWRWKTPPGTGPRRRDFAQPRWTGETLDGGTLLLYAEQGVGDILQFCRYVPLVAKTCSGASILFEIDKRLVAVARETFGDVAAIFPYEGRRGGNLPTFDRHAALMNLPHILGTTLDTVPAAVPYLKPASPVPERRDDRFTVGLSWLSKAPNTGAIRTIPLALLAPLGRVAGIRFVNLQYGDTAEERHAAAEQVGFLIDSDDSLDFKTDLVAFTSHVAACDLVISIDNTTVHMAGALGRPVWTLLPTVPDWRWMLDREDSPWYPTMRLFRQRRAGDWDDVIDRVRNALATCEGTG